MAKQKIPEDEKGGRPRFAAQFWGTRGSIASSGPETLRYGGNTSCVEIVCGKRQLIFDAGTGLRKLGQKIAAEKPQEIDLFLTHTHLDHIIALPFFAPFYMDNVVSRVWAGHLLPDYTLKQILSDMMQAPLFPIPPETFRSRMRFIDFKAGETLHPSVEISLKTAPLNHPNRACGYRVEFDGRSICYITDTEHYPEGRDETVLELVRGADIMIYDSTYTDEEYPQFVGYGHSTWQEGCRVADAAEVKTLVLFHHEPSHHDDKMDEIAAAAAERRPGTLVAREGMVLEP